ncbi:NAD(+)/NADH kinase [Engelhardtia mirabilis]|uniref:NAD kinase n=1 Tax=Engelhardtia mirabilis TaxID=2528011 RepID=A0A518BJV0_9BACT|nr:putative inorganic polyphosphate/ATP-NAD kinase [Planctomycetes bacterium Pla133]QDV01572.1 putative inorganic polyphosphate/ATP-NAD kinase [Planctomycetes bacterium Pla86]
MDPTKVDARPSLRLETRVERVLVLTHSDKVAATQLAARLLPWLEERVTRVDSHGDLLSFAREREHDLECGAAIDVPDLVVVLGGDGAMLTAVRAFRDHPVPTLGINFGRVGFLASTPVTRWEETLQGVLDGEGVLEPRMRLLLRHRSAAGESQAVALNDLVVSRRPEESMLHLGLDVGVDWVTDYRADGLIVASPSGSTAYALSAGGPILAPSMLGIVVVPICSQGLSTRPIVLHPDHGLRVRLVDDGAEADIVVDGQRFATLGVGDELLLARHPVPYPLLSLPGLDPYRRLRERLGWSGEIRS